MLPPEIDQYYTPPDLARLMVEAAGVVDAAMCFDSACGTGSLLAAAQEVLGVQCVGMEVDRSAVRTLRREHPEWILSRADALCRRAWASARASRESVGCDLALLNPPFSMARERGTLVRFPGFEGRSSVAMAHLMTVLLRSQPRTCCAVVPESLMYSELDSPARGVLESRYELEECHQLANSTFKGARANALVLRFSKRTVERKPAPLRPEIELPEGVELVRGGLPVFQAIEDDLGVPFIHSTDLAGIVRAGVGRPTRRVRPIERGVIRGHAVLLPRVGVASREATSAVFLDGDVQLSDCVFAVLHGSAELAWRTAETMLSQWERFLELYRGTGARYTTVTRLKTWLARSL